MLVRARLRNRASAFVAAGSVTSIRPLSDVNAMAFSGVTRSSVASTLPLVVWATTAPATWVKVILPFVFEISRSPSAPSTEISLELTVDSFKCVRVGTWTSKSTP